MKTWTWTVQITFLSPYRIVCREDQKKKNSAFRRGGTFARWHSEYISLEGENKGENIGRPYITGTLVRSALFTELKKLRELCFSKTDGSKFACNGIDVSTEQFTPDFLSRGLRYISRPDDSKERRDWCGKCPLCIILGRVDKEREKKREKKKKTDKQDLSLWSVHFSNFWEFDPEYGRGKREFCWKDHVASRIINRIDHFTGKARDYMRIWEMEPETCRFFQGTITFNIRPDSMGPDGEILKRIQSFMAAGLASVNLLAGSLCRVDIVNGEGPDHNGLIRSFISSLKTSKEPTEIPAPQFLSKQLETTQPEEPKDMSVFGKMAETIQKIYTDPSQQYDKLRRLADAIRELRRFSREELDELPKAKGDHEKNKTDWDMKLPGGNCTLWEYLEAHSSDLEEFSWRAFCENLGRALYAQAQRIRPQSEVTARSQALPRLLGEVEFHGIPMHKSEESEEQDSLQANYPYVFWIIDSVLEADTPFFFGTESSQGQTSIPILLKKNGRFRLPRSVLRGALRRDLRQIIGDDCLAPVGGEPCQCSVCRIMRRVIVSDCESECNLPPEFRYRIRINPHTGTVEQGALFDMETGFQGIRFPLRMYVQSSETDIPDENLMKVLAHWKNGMAFMGGGGGNGFGCFRLGKIFRTSLRLKQTESLLTYLLARGFKGMSWNDISSVKRGGEWGGEDFISDLPWHQDSYSLQVVSPLLSRDPISAMLDKRCPDTVMICKTILGYAEDSKKFQEKKVYFIKAETIRGLLRHIVSRNIDEKTGKYLYELDHEDCDCLQCKLFGSVHRQSQIRIEDAEIFIGSGDKEILLEVNDSPEKREDKLMDHVAIDRFTGGGRDKMKFNEYALPASPEKPLILKSRIWLHRNILSDREAKEALGQAFGKLIGASIGGLSAIGYGRIGAFSEKPEWVTETPPRTVFEKADRVCLGKAVPASEPKPEKIYHPHCFIKPPENKAVQRTTELISHVAEAYENSKGKEALFSGVITCRLETCGPVFTPDTETDNYFNMPQPAPQSDDDKDDKRHKNFGFFRIKEQVAIPGSSLRGMISSVYETLTNSCFRVMDTEKKLSWRMKADGDELKDFVPGRIWKDKEQHWKMDELEDYLRENKDGTVTAIPIRLPIYDNPKLMDKKWTPAGKKINENAEKFRESLKKLESKGLELPFSQKVFRPDYEKPTEKHEVDRIAVKLKKGDREGYIKFSGPNKVEVLKTDEVPENWVYDDSLKSEWSEIIHNDCEIRENKERNKTQYIPSYRAQKGDYVYTMNKRCERIFLKKAERNLLNIPDSVIARYKQLLAEYKENAERNKIPEIFRTILPSDEPLNIGDLVYFRHDGKNVTDIAPVKISRIVDDQPVGKKLPHESLQPCTHTCLEECEECPARCEKVSDYFKPHPEGLCPACHLFGTPYYKGRVSFGMAWLENKTPKWYIPAEEPGKGGKLTLPLLERPRPTWSMPTGKSVIPGRKFYIHHPWSLNLLKSKQPDTKDLPEDEKIKPNENNRTIEPLDKGNIFTFNIRFDNLRKWELGLLLYALELEDNLAHKLGLGKALGLGSVRISVEKIETEGNEECPDKQELIRKGFDKLGISDVQSNNLENFPHIRQLRDALWFPDESGCQTIKVRYPSLTGDKVSFGNQEKDIPGYAQFVKQNEKDTGNKNKFFLEEKDRLKFLQSPWGEWYPLKKADV